ncbi:sperm flagellar protein 1 [Protopterus annectens]|uniref:sperm flagellar protein 1 n=1 Tax=Protopterus annectens TaxID=7888 RepID=UPI001CFAEEAD|nr:sperm flagellar protein 1 [Protopterus annectens]
MAVQLDEDLLQDLYAWVDKIPLSRPKKNICRDFSDGVLAGELVKFYFPKLVEMHNYVPANSTQQKVNNWMHLNRKVFKKLNFSIPDDIIQKISRCSPGVIEVVLNTLREKINVKQTENEHKMTFSSQERVDNAVEDHKDGRSARLKTKNTLTGNNPHTYQGNKHSSLSMRHTSRKHAKDHHMDNLSYAVMEIQQQQINHARLKTKNTLTGNNPHTYQGNKHSSLSQNEVPVVQKTEFEARNNTIQEKESFLVYQETIQILQAKVQRLEQLVQLKDTRIEELSKRIQQMEKNHIVH